MHYKALWRMSAAVVAIAWTISPASAGLVNYYTFDAQTLVDEADTFSFSSSTTATDLTVDDPASMGTTFVNGRYYDPNENPGDYAFYLQGTRGSTSYGEALVWPGADADLDLGQNFTLQMWVHPAGAYGWSGGGSSYARIMVGSADSVSISMGPGATGGSDNTPQVTVGNSTIVGNTWSTADQWHHLTIVGRDDNTFTYYWDTGILSDPNDPNSGVEVVIDGANTSFTPFTALQLGIASNGGYYHNVASYYVDNIAMWDEALDYAAIADIVANGVRETTPTLPGDANDDGIVDSQDFTILKANFGQAGGWSEGDFNNDGLVDSQDFTILKAYFGQTAPAPVPEPATLSLLALGGLALIRRKR